MLTKILITLLVIVGAAVTLRNRMEGRPGVREAARAERPKPPLHLRLLPYGLVLSALAIGALFYWMDWQEAHRLFTVRVTNTQNGEVRSYPVYRDDVHGRSFQTVDGRVVELADVEHMELLANEP
ncbi:hypothetical protein [Endothiovibrio diazotrophicus]